MPGWSAEALVRRHAREAGAATALAAGETTISWSELDRRIDAGAGLLRARGVRAGQAVAMVVDAPIEAVVGILAAIRLGAVAAPVPAGLTSAEIEAASATLDPALLARSAAALFGEAGEGAGGEAPPGATPAAGRALTAPAVTVLTSGTTGRPKGVVLSGAALAASADAWLAALPPVAGWLLPVGLGHVAGLGVVWRAIRDRAPVRFLQPADAAGLLAAIYSSDPVASHVSLVPAQLARLLDLAGGEPPPASLRAVLLGGGSIPPPLVKRALAAGWPVVTTYGLSETGSGATALPTTEARQAPWQRRAAAPRCEARHR